MNAARASMLIVLAACAAAAAGCGSREHLWKSYGYSYNTAAQRQIVHPRAGTREVKATTGLDSQEASIVSDTLRKGMAPPKTRVEDEQLLLVSPNKAGKELYYVPPPSVPNQAGGRTGTR